MARPKYNPGDLLRHHKGQVYQIHLVPDEFPFPRVEATGEPAYGYAKFGDVIDATNPMWFRDMDEVEDTKKFVRCANHPGKYESILKDAPPPRKPELLIEFKAEEFKDMAGSSTQACAILERERNNVVNIGLAPPGQACKVTIGTEGRFRMHVVYAEKDWEELHRQPVEGQNVILPMVPGVRARVEYALIIHETRVKGSK